MTLIAQTQRNPRLPVYAEIVLTNAGDLALSRRGRIMDAEVGRFATQAIVDANFYDLSIPESVCSKLGLPLIQKRLFRLPGEEQVELDVVGPVDVRFQDRHATMNAIVISHAAGVLVGKRPMAAMGVMVNVEESQLVVIPGPRRL